MHLGGRDLVAEWWNGGSERRRGAALTQAIVDRCERRRSFDIREYGAVLDGTTPCDQALADAFEAMKADGTHANGRLLIPGLCRLEEPAVFDGGWSEVATEANWDAGDGGRFTLDMCDGAFVCDAGLVDAVTVKGFYDPIIDVRFQGGGEDTDTGLYIENLIGATLDIHATAFAGTVLRADKSTSAKRIVNCLFRNVVANGGCGRLMSLTDVEAFGTFLNVFDQGSVEGSLFDGCADVGILQWGSFTTATQDVGLHFLSCNSFQVGVITMGDRPTEALVKIEGGDFGRINQIRASGRPDVGTDPQITGLMLEDVGSVDIDTVQTFRCDKGVHIIGGSAAGIRIKRHFSLTADRNPLYVEGSDTQTEPDITIGVHYRSHRGASVVVEDTITGGRLRISGRTRDMWLDGPSTHYAIECSSSGMVIDPADFWQITRSALAGSISHPDPTKIVNVGAARLEQGVVHGATAAALSVTAGVAQQNASGRTLFVTVTADFNTSGGASFLTGVIGPTSGTLASVVRETKPTTTGNEQRSIVLIVPPWWWFRADLVNATINATYTTAYSL